MMLYDGERKSHPNLRESNLLEMKAGEEQRGNSCLMSKQTISYMYIVQLTESQIICSLQKNILYARGSNIAFL
jgi:hypothetical protein